MSPARSSAVWPALVLLPLTAACGGGGSSPGTPAELPLLSLSDTPTLEIGVLEGDPAYQFQEIVSTLRLPPGEIVVSDAGANEIAVYSSDGEALRRFGGRGEGPGEFSALSRLYLRDGLILASQTGRDRFSTFDPDGTFRGTRDIASFSQDTTFQLDVWLYGRFWVDGALEEEARAPVRAALDRVPSPSAPPGFRYVRVASDGRLWVREPGRDLGGSRRWTILDAEGRAEASIRTPGRFEPRLIGANEVIGRWLGEAEVHFVRAYEVVETGESVTAPRWLVEPPPEVQVERADEEEVRPVIVSSIKFMASAQEIHYSRNYTYTTEVDSMELWQRERPENLDVTFVTADRRGWSAVFAHPGFDRVCALGYGSSVPPGWTPGMVICAPPRDSDGEVD